MEFGIYCPHPLLKGGVLAWWGPGLPVVRAALFFFTDSSVIFDALAPTLLPMGTCLCLIQPGPASYAFGIRYFRWCLFPAADVHVGPGFFDRLLFPEGAHVPCRGSGRRRDVHPFPPFPPTATALRSRIGPKGFFWAWWLSVGTELPSLKFRGSPLLRSRSGLFLAPRSRDPFPLTRVSQTLLVVRRHRVPYTEQTDCVPPLQGGVFFFFFLLRMMPHLSGFFFSGVGLPFGVTPRRCCRRRHGSFFFLWLPCPMPLDPD